MIKLFIAEAHTLIKQPVNNEFLKIKLDDNRAAQTDKTQNGQHFFIDMRFYETELL